MSTSHRRPEASPSTGSTAPQGSLERTASLLGGRLVLKRRFASRLDVHEAIVKGLPGNALKHIVANVKVLGAADVLQAVGVSIRTVQRRTETPRKPLSQEQGGRAWKFAEILAKATDVFGGQEEAENWLATPAMALDRHRPIDLLASPAGVEMVEQMLGRLEAGVYT